MILDPGVVGHGAAAVWLGALVLGWTGLIVGLVVGVVVSGISYGIQAALYKAPILQKPSTGIDNLRTIQKDNLSPWRVVYGTQRISGVLMFARSVNVNGLVKVGGPYLHFALAVAHGPISDMYQVQLNDEPADSVKFAHLAMFIQFMGQPDQGMFRGPLVLQGITIQLPSEWLEAYRPARTVAYLWGVLKFDIKLFPGGPPNVRVTVDGRLLYDPRQDVSLGGAMGVDDPNTWHFSNNWALCVRDYLTNRDYGQKIPDALICASCCIAAANVADEQIEAVSDEDPAQGTPKLYITRYAVDGVFQTDEQRIDVLSKLITAGAGAAHNYDGLWHIKAGTAEPWATDITTGAPIVLTPDDLRNDSPLQANPVPGRKDMINTVRGTYVNQKKQWLPDDFGTVSHPDYVAQDGNEEFPIDVQFDYTSHVDRARALARIMLQQGRLPRKVVWPGKPSLLQIVPWSVVGIAYPNFGWGSWGAVTVTAGTNRYDGIGVGAGLTVGQTIQVIGCAVAGNNGAKTVNAVLSNNAILVNETLTTEGPTVRVSINPKLFRVSNRTQNSDGGIDLELMEYSDQIYADVIDPRRLPVGTTLPNPFTLEPPTNVAVTVTTQVNPDGTRVAKVTVTWDPPADGVVDGYRVSWISTAGGTAWQSMDIRAPGQSAVILGLAPGTYYVAVAALLNTKVSASVTLTATVTYATVPPPDPIDFRVRLDINGVHAFSWRLNGPTPPDIKGYEIRYNTGAHAATLNEWNAAKVLNALVRTQSFETTFPYTPGDYTFFVRALDTQGFYSNGLASLQVTIEITVPDIVLQQEYGEQGWPTAGGGSIVDGRVNGEGHLEGRSTRTWAQMGTWSAASTWGTKGLAVTYTTPEIDVGQDRTLRIDWSVCARTTGGVAVQARAVREDGTTTVFTVAGAVTGRYFQFRLVAYADTVAPVIERFAVTGRTDLDEQIVQDVPMTGVTGVLARNEQRLGDWWATPWAYNIRAQRVLADVTALTIDNAPALVFDGSTTIATVPDATPLRLQGGEATIEAAIQFGALPGGTVVLMGKGTDWRMSMASSGHVQLMLNNVTVTGADIVLSGALPWHHVAFAIGHGRVESYLNGAHVGGVSTTLMIPTSANPFRIGADQAGSQKFTGSIREVRVWNVQRSSDEISRDAARAISGASAQLAAYYRLDNGNGIDSGPNGLTATLLGTVGFVRSAYRESTPIPLNLFPFWLDGTLRVVGASHDGSMTLQYSVDNATWHALTLGVTTDIVGLVVGVQYPGTQTIRLRQFLTVPNVTGLEVAPSIDRIETTITYLRAPGDAVVQPHTPLMLMAQAELVAIQDVTAVHPAASSLVVKHPAGARFRVFDASAGTPLDAVLDVRLAGGRSATA